MAADDRDRGDRLAIRDLVENRAVWRDAGDWERFATVWPWAARRSTRSTLPPASRSTRGCSPPN
jgi:hypothetical protein